MSSRKSSPRKILRRGVYRGLEINLGRGRKAVVLDARPSDRMKEFAGRDEQGILFQVKLPEGTEHRVDLLVREEEHPGSIAVYVDASGRSATQATAWKATFEEREDGAILVHPSLAAGDIEDFLASRLTEAGLLVLRKEGRIILGAPLFPEARRDERDRIRMFAREALSYALVRGEIERRLRYPPGMEPPPIEIPGKSDGGKRSRKSRSRSKKKAPVPGPTSPPAVAAGKTPAARSAAGVPPPPAKAKAGAPRSPKAPKGVADTKRARATEPRAPANPRSAPSGSHAATARTHPPKRKAVAPAARSSPRSARRRGAASRRK